MAHEPAANPGVVDKEMVDWLIPDENKRADFLDLAGLEEVVNEDGRADYVVKFHNQTYGAGTPDELMDYMSYAIIPDWDEEDQRDYAAWVPLEGGFRDQDVDGTILGLNRDVEHRLLDVLGDAGIRWEGHPLGQDNLAMHIDDYLHYYFNRTGRRFRDDISPRYMPLYLDIMRLNGIQQPQQRQPPQQRQQRQQPQQQQRQ